LVQEQYGLSDGSAIRLTVARYFTPSGRSIQRPYDKGKKIYMEELLDRYNSGEMLNADSFHMNKGKRFTTTGGRTVYGGGGISPDVFVPVDSSLYIQSITKLYLEGRFNNFVYQYYMGHYPEIQQYKSPSDFAARYTNTSEAWNQLVAFAMKDSINLQKVPRADRKEVEDRIKAYLARFKWRTQGFYEVSNTMDDMVLQARKVLSR
ncbi:MAG: carboxyl-terminal protease, partial [Chitinophagaceae bacterium]